MKIVSLADAKTHLSAYVEEAQEQGPVVITKNGKAVAVLLALLDDADLEGILIAHSPRFQALLERSRQSIRAEGSLSETEFWDQSLK
jgi:prevent-host-death family protein